MRGSLRVCTLVATFAATGGTTGCSLILDFSDKAVPVDAMIDGPFPVSECAYKEPNDSIEQAAAITAQDAGPGAICPPIAPSGADDHDFYRFNVPSGATSVTIKITFDSRSNGDLDLRLWDPLNPTTFVSQSRGVGAGEMITCPAQSPACPTLAAQDYVFEVFPAVAGAVNDYMFTVDIAN